VRGDDLARGMSDYLVRDILQRPNIDVRLGTEAVAGEGDASLRRLTLRHRSNGATESVDASVVYVLVGADPHTEWLAGSVERDRHGFILTGVDLPRTRRGGGPPLLSETSLPGVFAAGDARAASVKRVATAVGEGAVAVRSIHDYLAAPVDVARNPPRRAGRRSGRAASGSPVPVPPDPDAALPLLDGSAP
jgi:thioredoxin reductase (NADPH)